jgi:predicted DCC family thiol-disulfide oxidoreductase YuxK
MTFVNYFGDADRRLPINAAVGRLVLGVYLVWKLLSYEWGAMQAWPVKLRSMWLGLWPETLQAFVVAEQWMAVAVLLLFVVGYRIRITAVVSALLVAHLTTYMYAFTASGQTTSFFIGVYFLVFYAVYHDQSRISVDELRQTGRRSIDELNRFLKSSARGVYRADALRWGLLALALIYFGSGYDKIVNTPATTWLRAENLGRILIHKGELYHTAKPVADLLLSYPPLLSAATVGTLLLEVGFVLAVVAGVTITPFIVAFLGLHTVIALAVGPFFFDLYVFFLLFLPWDSLVGRIASAEPLEVVYDERCHFCVRSLYLFKYLDVHDSVTFYSQSDVPSEYVERPDVAPGSEVYAFRDGRAYGGYHAFRVLFGHVGVLVPLALVLRLPPAEWLGKRVYRYVADHRGSHFRCTVEGGD